MASIAALAAALLCKAQAVPLPVALVILDVYPLRRVARDGRRRIIADKLRYFALAVAGGVVAIAAVKLGAAFTADAQYGLLARLGMTPYGLVFYPWTWLSPVALSPIYELPAHVDPPSWRFAAPLIVLVLVTAALVAGRRRWPAGLAAWTHSVVMLLPVVGPLHAGNQLAHDRYSYLSGLGFAVLAGAGLACVLRSAAQGTLRRPIALGSIAVAACVVLGLGSQASLQARVWQDSESLWMGAVEVDPACALCWNNPRARRGAQTGRGPAGAAAIAGSARVPDDSEQPRRAPGIAGRLDEAEREYRRAVQLNPDLGQALANLGALYVKQARYQAALSPLRRALEVAPELPRVRANFDQSLRRHATQLIEGGRPDAGNALLREAAVVQP